MKTKQASRQATVTYDLVTGRYTVRVFSCTRSGTGKLLVTRPAANLRAVQFILRASRIDGSVIYVMHDTAVATVDTSVQAAYC